MDTHKWISTRRTLRHLFVLVTIVIVGSATPGAHGAEEKLIDTQEGEDLTLKCRFGEQELANFSYYWARSTGANFENVAIGEIRLSANYKLDFRPERGIYDLQILNASYARDNGRFECRIKAVGPGADVHQEYYNITVLTPPQPPMVAPGAISTATENKLQELTCSSIGGSPDPTITWYREGSTVPLQAPVSKGGSKDHQTTSTLSVTPRREDDGAKFRCVVWNRAMPAGQRLEATVTLNVNYYPRVEIGPANPLRIERDHTARLECNVDAKPKVTNVRWTRNGRFLASSPTYTIHRVSVQDAGRYACSADNGLGNVGEQEIELDILSAPQVVIETKTREAEAREAVRIRCNITANPEPVTIEWLKEGSPEFRFAGDVLELNDIRAEHAGNYVCRAVNILKPYGGKQVEREGNSSVALLVRHRPGQAHITPNRPIVHAGNGVTLTCSANPPGWPVPQYRWFRNEGGSLTTDANITADSIRAQGPQYVIPHTHLANEGNYQCQAVNELGDGEPATIRLEVHQAPQFIAKLPQHMTRRVADADFSVSCSAKGKPPPQVMWLKDGVEITASQQLFEVTNNPIEEHNGMVNVQSKLRFVGKARPADNQLMPGDRGLYTCLYQNEVNTANASMQLRIEHAPIVLHQHNKVAYDLRETAEVRCMVQSYPKPEFQWQFGNNQAALSMSSEGHYEINTTTDNNDVYTSVLRIHNVAIEDYGEYLCRVVNALETIRVPLRLQTKGAPERPNNLQEAELMANSTALRWDAGFDGGLANTKFFVAYRKVTGPHDDQMLPDCGTNLVGNTDWMEYDCQQRMPCTVNYLDQHQSYLFKVKALNTKGASEYSNELLLTTKVAKIPAPQLVTFDPATRSLGIDVEPTCLALNAIVESVINGDTSLAAWQNVATIPIAGTGQTQTHRDAVIEYLQTARMSSARSLSVPGEDFPPLEDDLNPRVRVKLCLRVNNDHCGEYTEAEIGPAVLAEASALATPTLIAIIVSCVVFALFVGLLLMFCRCKRNQSKKGAQVKDYEMDSVRPSIVAQQNQAPPPYYPASGLENKALEHSMDLALAAMDEQKGSAVYATQNGYGYHPQQALQVPGQHMAGNEWVNMGYMENSYSNSNNGGSVNSQDSLWQMKMSAAAGNAAQMAGGQHFVDHAGVVGGGGVGSGSGPIGGVGVGGGGYGGYDALTHGGYGAVDDYAPYPHLATPSQHGGDDYHTMRNSQNPSRQDYCSDPYAAVHKPKKRMDQHMDSPYHDVSGLPDPYMDHQMDGVHPDDQPKQHQQQQQHQQQHMSLGYDETLESGYSTPNSRNRRVIREIIV